MPESACRACGKPVTHADGDVRPLCDHCTQVEYWIRILTDICDGKLDVPPLYSEQGDPVG